MLVGVLPNLRVNIDGYISYFRAELDIKLRCPEVSANLSTSCITENIQTNKEVTFKGNQNTWEFRMWTECLNALDHRIRPYQVYQPQGLTLMSQVSRD